MILRSLFFYTLPIGGILLDPGSVSVAAERVMEIPADGRVPIMVNGIASTAMVSPSDAIRPVIAANLAQSAEVQRKKQASIRIGPMRLTAFESKADFEIDGERRSRAALILSDKFPFREQVSMGPLDIPSPIVVFRLRPELQDDEEFVFPLSDFSADGGGLGLAITLGPERLRIAFKPTRPVSLATARAGTLIAVKRDGQFSGAPNTVEVAYGVARPSRRISLRTPLIIGPLRIAALDARISDYGETSISVPTSPNEIAVSGISAKDPRDTRLTVGAEHLSHCSSLAIDKKRMTLTLICRPT